ncbi:hypothetical protein D3C76_1593640 [compost metagenome]
MFNSSPDQTYLKAVAESPLESEFKKEIAVRLAISFSELAFFSYELKAANKHNPARSSPMVIKILDFSIWLPF